MTIYNATDIKSIRVITNDDKNLILVRGEGFEYKGLFLDILDESIFTQEAKNKIIKIVLDECLKK